MIEAMRIPGGLFLISLSLLLSMDCSLGQASIQVSRSFSHELENIAFNDTRIYVAENSKIHVLDIEDLSSISNVSTCQSNCKNINRLLLVNGNDLITCGTGNNGVCQIRTEPDIGTVVKNSRDSELNVTNNIQRPVIGTLLSENELLLLMTYAPGLKIKTPASGLATTYTYSYLAQIVIVRPAGEAFRPQSLTSKNKNIALAFKSRDSIDSYLIYHKKVLESGNSIYIATNQKNFVTYDRYITKLIRICKDDPHLYTYVDIVIKCTKDNKDYNLLQDAMILDADEKLFVGTFTSADDPEAVHGDSAICVEKLSVLDQKIAESTNNGSISDENRYLANVQEGRNNLGCDTASSLQTYNYVIGRTPHKMLPVYTLSSDQGYITKVSGHMEMKTDTAVIQAGTSRGHFIQMYMRNFGDQLVEYEKVELDRASPVSAIYNSGDKPFIIMTRTKLIKFPKHKCSGLSSCPETMSAQNPYCGWCVYQERSTTYDMCQENGTNHWLSIFTQCVSMTLDPEGQLADGTPGQVNLTVSELPEKLPGDSYMCKFMKNGEVFSEVNARDDAGYFICDTPAMTEHMKIILELWVNTLTGSSLQLAHTDFLFYKCDYYEKCSECVNAVGATCVWCKLTAACSAACNNNTVTTFDQCPQLLSNSEMYVPHGVSQQIEVQGKNLVIDAEYTCVMVEMNVSLPASINISASSITCPLNLSAGEEKKVSRELVILYKITGTDVQTELDDAFGASVVIYRCDKLGADCSHCRGLNLTRYNCDWCEDTCGFNDTDCTPVNTCPAAFITQVSPRDGPNKGGTTVTITGRDLGVQVSDIKTVTLGNALCTDISASQVSDGEDFQFDVPEKITCLSAEVIQGEGQPGVVKVMVNGQLSSGVKSFTYLVPMIGEIFPSFGPKAGGTRVRFRGNNLGIGNHNVTLTLNGVTPFDDCFVYPKIFGVNFKTNYSIQCTVPDNLLSNISSVQLRYYPSTYSYNYSISFKLLQNPDIQKLSSQATILSGGTVIEVEGRYFNNAHICRVSVTYQGVTDTKYSDICKIKSSQSATLRAPKAPDMLQEDLNYRLNETTRQKREVTPTNIVTTMTLEMDGIAKGFNITYFPNPTFDRFPNNVLLFDSDNKQLTLTGSRLDLIAEKEDYYVTIGTEECSILELTNMTLTCVAPKDQPNPSRPGSSHPEVNVTVGNINFFIGFVEYKVEVEIYTIIIAVVSGTILALAVIGVVVGVCMYKKQSQQKLLLEKKLQDTEMEIKRIAREEFLDMHTTMLSVNKNLVEQGFPYQSYQTYACNVMFAAEQLQHDQVVFNPSELASRLSSKARRGMDALEQLLLNKFFIVSLISTLEKQKRFFFREKANFAGNLCAVLLGKMPYLQEIVLVLLENFVQEAVTKKHHKTLFRRCESITENMLSNWLALTLYPHFKSYSGSPLYLLYMAMQKTMESGPIDMLTSDTKCTLSEEKLLKNWSSTDIGVTEVKFEVKTLTLKVVIDNGETVYDCKALDCDTISQVKAKCLAQIYVNFPASQLKIDPKELELQWHAGHSGSLNLKDEDNTSNIEGDWLRLNTLAHYNLQDGSNLALIDPKSADVKQQENYVNLQQVTLETKLDNDSSILIQSAGIENENSLPQRRWHLVKPSSENTEKTERSAIEDLYLNRLFTTKQSIVQYMTSLFDTILDHKNCPPPIKFLYDLLDELGEKHRVDVDTLHAWKSHSYAIRVWGILIRQPYKLFDINVPSYVEDSLDVIAQVFNESFSLTAQKFTKDSSAQKLIFHNEMNHTRERVKTFYNGVKFLDDQPEVLSTYLSDLNNVQLQDNGFFNKTVFLHKLFQQIQPYLDEINDDLSMNKDCCKLGLNRKLEELISSMEGDA